MPKEKRTSLRLDEDQMTAIEALCEQRPGKVSANTWILEAISEKLQRDGTPQGGDDA